MSSVLKAARFDEIVACAEQTGPTLPLGQIMLEVTPGESIPIIEWDCEPREFPVGMEGRMRRAT